MNKTNTQADFTSDFDKRVGMASSHHYAGEFEIAEEKYHQLLDEWPDHIDANYGMALTLRRKGQKAKALQYFEKVRKLVEVEAAKAGPEESRMPILLRMIDQQIALCK